MEIWMLALSNDRVLSRDWGLGMNSWMIENAWMKYDHSDRLSSRTWPRNDRCCNSWANPLREVIRSFKSRTVHRIKSANMVKVSLPRTCTQIVPLV